MTTLENIEDMLNLARAGFVRSPFHYGEPFVPISTRKIDPPKKPVNPDVDHYRRVETPNDLIFVVEKSSISQTTLPSHQKPEKKS